MTEQNKLKFRFLTTFVVPALLVFLVPVISFFFFRHAQDRYDAKMRDSIIEKIRADRSITEEQRAAAIAFFTATPFSQLILNDQFAAATDNETRIYFAMFRWMIVMSAASIIAGVAMFLLAGACVALSLRSQYAQYLSLLASWHVLRIYGALQAVVQGVLLVALSFWVTALWTNSYSLKLVLVVGILAVIAVGLVIAAIFKRVNNDFRVAGRVLAKDEAAPIWDELRRICERVGADLPDQIIAGIDDNFFVTEHDVTVDGKIYKGRTLFVSLSLLKQVHGSEADAVLAHEMAHFSGQDTLYSRKTAPLLGRYNQYLQALRQGGVTLPIYYFMLCFRALFELSLSRQSRQREFRADQIAVEATSARDFAGAMLRTVAYSRYRAGVEQALFQEERALETANVCDRIELGFRDYAATFLTGPDIGQMAPAHPFDSHPPMSQRLQAIGMPLESTDAQSLLAGPGDARWFQYVPGAEQMEKEQWQHYEEQFRLYHEQSLPYRFLPETPEEFEIVVKHFPTLSISGKKGVLTLDHEKMTFDGWPEPIRFAQITNLTLADGKVLTIAYQGQAKRTQSIKLSKFNNHQEVLDAINRYYGRYRAAVEYKQMKKASAGAKS